MNENVHYLEKLINPKSVAIIGAGDNPLRINGRALMFMLRHQATPKIYPVNPKRNDVQGITCYQAIDEIPEVPDVGMVIVSKKLVPSVLNDLGQKGCRFAIVTSAGYAESGSAGRKEQEKLLVIAKKYGMRLMGPNCLGLVNNHGPVILSWCATLEREPNEVRRGDVGLVSQSGALLGSIWDRALKHHLGYSCLLSTGNEADLGLSDFIEYFALDENTSTVTCFVEGLRKPEAFIKAVKLCHSKKKPVVVYKVGRTDEGAAVAASHTGALTGSDETFEALCRANGIIRVNSLDSLITTALALSKLPAAKGNRVGVFSCSGGASGLISDKIGDRGLQLAKVSDEFEKDMTHILGWSPPHNPVDIAKGPLASFDVISDAMKRFYKEDAFDQIIILMTMMYFQDVAPDLMLKGLKDRTDKPVIACWIGDKVAEVPALKMRKGGIPTYHQVEHCLDAAQALYSWGRYQSKLAKDQKLPEPPDGAKDKALALIKSCDGKLDEVDSKKLISFYGLSVPNGGKTDSMKEAVLLGKKLGYPLVLKGVSPSIFHKTEAGLIHSNINTDKALKAAFSQIESKLKALPDGTDSSILVEKFLPPPQLEVIIGSVYDNLGFHKILFGIGGIYVEILKDTSVRLAPINTEDAEEMISETRANKFFEGLRGQRPIDKKSVVNSLFSLSQMVIDMKDEIAEVEINPLFVYPGQAVAVDALVKLK